MADTDATERMRALVSYASTLAGYEKGEAQVFCDRLFKAFGHEGYKEAGATLEFQVKRPRGRGTKFADLLWRPRLLIEMKSRGEDLAKHFRQAFEYWIEIVPNRPRYVVLCNFDEFWIYDFNVQIDSPVDRVTLADLPDRYTALNFLFPDNPRPLFDHDKVSVTRETADLVASLFQALIGRGETRETAQRFILQSVVTMFAEDFGLLPKDLLSYLVADCVEGASSYDLIGGLFRQMADPKSARGGRYADVRYFNGGLFSTVEAIELTKEECTLLGLAAAQRWSAVAPPIFGTLFQRSMDAERRHALGAHFTAEADIQKVVLPTIVTPWLDRLDATSTRADLESLLKELLAFRVLDPACGSGNFLYVAYRELVNVEMEILRKLHENYGERARKAAGSRTLISTTQFHGIDIDPFAVELAKVTLMLAKRIAVAETRESRFAAQHDLPFEFEKPLPLDNLDENIVAGDALFLPWPKADAIVSNPPYQSKNKMQQEYGAAYVHDVRARYPDVPGRADYCVYWFRRAHDELPKGGRAGLVGTNTIRQNYSREGGLDYIVQNGGTITQAVSSQVWSGEAIVHVSIVNWLKGSQPGKKKLFRQLGDDTDSPWDVTELSTIPPTLSERPDVSQAHHLTCAVTPETTYQGQTQGDEAFVLSPEEARAMIASDVKNAEVIYPFLIGDDILGSVPPAPQRYVIDFSPRDILSAQRYAVPFKRVKATVLPAREKAAAKEAERNAALLKRAPHARVNRHHANFLARWWHLSYPRGELMSRLGSLSRYIACSRVTKRPIFVFVAATVHPGDALQVFVLDDDYSFGILQSGVHWEWFTERCSSFKADPRYTSNTVYDTFAWPQSPSLAEARAVAKAGRAVRTMRSELMAKHGLSLRELYRSMEQPGGHPLKLAHSLLDDAVRTAYGMAKRDKVLNFLFDLNAEVYKREGSMQAVVGPGLPPSVKNHSEFVTEDCFEPLLVE